MKRREWKGRRKSEEKRREGEKVMRREGKGRRKCEEKRMEGKEKM